MWDLVLRTLAEIDSVPRLLHSDDGIRVWNRPGIIACRYKHQVSRDKFSAPNIVDIGPNWKVNLRVFLTNGSLGASVFDLNVDIVDLEYPGS